MVGRLLLAAGLLAAVTACSETGASGRTMVAQADSTMSESTGESPATLVEWKGQQSLVADETSIVATTQAEWEALWRNVGGEPPAALPGDRFAVGVFLGRRSTAGYGAGIVSAAEHEGAFVVVYEEHAPSGPAAMVLTYPYLIRLFATTELPVRVEKQP